MEEQTENKFNNSFDIFRNDQTTNVSHQIKNNNNTNNKNFNPFSTEDKSNSPFLEMSNKGNLSNNDTTPSFNPFGDTQSEQKTNNEEIQPKSDDEQEQIIIPDTGFSKILKRYIRSIPENPKNDSYQYDISPIIRTIPMEFEQTFVAPRLTEFIKNKLQPSESNVQFVNN